MQKKIFFGVNLIFLRKKGVFFGRFSAFYGQCSVTAAWATRSPWSIMTNSIKLYIYYISVILTALHLLHCYQTIFFSNLYKL